MTDKVDASLALITIVDNAGVTRLKSVPARRLPRAAEIGVGLSEVFAVMAVDDGITSSPGYETPSGDMRLVPDLQAAQQLHGTRTLWAPANMVDQEMEPRPNCGRSILISTVTAAEQAGFRVEACFETEFTAFLPDGSPAHDGPGYSPQAFVRVEDFAVEVVEALEAQGVDVEQFHPEYAAGQYEVSVRHRDALTAADQAVLTRITIRRVAARHGLTVSFSPRPHPEIEVGNGSHIHLSLWAGADNLFAEVADQPTGRGGAAVAGILEHLPGIQAVLTPSVPGFERITPHHWAGAYTCWGLENREAAVRVVRGSIGSRPNGANIEIKPVDASANPYLALTVILHAALDGIARNLVPPPQLTVDPDSLSMSEREQAGVKPLPGDLGIALEAMDADGLVRRVFGDAQYEAFRAVRAYELQTFGEMPRPDRILAHQQRY